jgi:hypothetical protein
MQKLRIVNYLKTFATQQKWKRTVKLVDFILSSYLKEKIFDEGCLP